MAKKSKMAISKKIPSRDPSYRKLKPGYTPTQLSYQLAVISDGPYAPAPWFHSVPQGLCEVNHRLYRRGRTYSIKIDIDNDATVEGNKVDIYALANTWWIVNAFAAARGAYDTAMAEERAAVGQVSRWHDFIPNNGFSSQFVGAALAQDATGVTIVARNDGEHIDSQVTDTSGNPREFTWGPTSGASAFSIPGEYDDMGRTYSSPDSVGSAGGYVEIDTNTNQADLLRLQQEGNVPPYSQTNTRGSNNNYLVKVATLELAGSGSKRLSTGWFDAPCGYVWFVGVGATFPDGKITVSCKKGDYKGVMAHSMAE